MRKIKFRAYNRIERCWEYSGSELHDFFYGIDDGQLDGETLGQYTGLKDKNDKEIYEGDIVETINSVATMSGNQNFLIRAKVVYFASAFRFEFNGKAGLAHSSCEVIGNIYENQELLTH